MNLFLTFTFIYVTLNREYFTFTYSADILHNVNEYNAELWNGPNN